MKASGARRQASGENERALGYAEPIRESQLLRLNERDTERASGCLAAEVPVALVYNGRPHVVMMCTPADLEDFAVGFTVTEQIAAAGEITRVDVVRYSRGIELQIEIAAPAEKRLEQRGRTMMGRTGCGLCGVELIDAALRDAPPVRSAMVVQRDALWRAGEELGGRQRLNEGVNAIHAAAWASGAGSIRVSREDVGRHNALDKVIGALLREASDPGAGFALVTSRASYELVQKVAVVGIPLLAAVSRPTALAVQLADDAGVTLVGLLRDRTANVYTHPGRIADARP